MDASEISERNRRYIEVDLPNVYIGTKTETACILVANYFLSLSDTPYEQSIISIDTDPNVTADPQYSVQGEHVPVKAKSTAVYNPVTNTIYRVDITINSHLVSLDDYLTVGYLVAHELAESWLWHDVRMGLIDIEHVRVDDPHYSDSPGESFARQFGLRVIENLYGSKFSLNENNIVISAE